MAYTKQTWQDNAPAPNGVFTAARAAHMEDGIEAAHLLADEKLDDVTVADLPAGTTMSVVYNGTTWPSRPTARTDIVVQWIDYSGLAAVPSGAVSGLDLMIQET